MRSYVVATWESEDPQYQWRIVAETGSLKLNITTDNVPTTSGAKEFLKALEQAIAWAENNSGNA